MWRKLFDVLFWLGASTYFGGMIMVAIAAPTIFATAKSGSMTMAGIVSPPLEMDRQVGGEIFGAILNNFATVEAASLTLLAVAIAGWILTNRSVRRSTWFIAALWGLLLGLTLYDTYAVRSRVWAMREDVRKTAAAHAGNPSGEWRERTTFETLHKRSESLGHWKAYLLLAMVVTAAWRGGAEKKQSAGIRRMRVMTPVP